MYTMDVVWMDCKKAVVCNQVELFGYAKGSIRDKKNYIEFDSGGIHN